MKRSIGYRIFSVGNIIFFVLLALVMVGPLYKVFITSIITVKEYYAVPLTLWPKEPTIAAYRFILSTGEIMRAARVTVFITFVGTILSMMVTLCLAYGLSKEFLPGGRIIHRIILFTMFIDSGLIPYYLMVRSLGLTNNLFANIVPALVSLWNYLVMRSFFKQLPKSLEEAALIDGAGWMTVFVRVVLPISKPVIATFTLFYAVAYWNSWWNSMLFCVKPELQTLQLFLRRLVITNESLFGMQNAYAAQIESREAVYTEAVKMACCVMATVPILCVYPFLQKHFTKGVMLGAIKG
jgi:putative aldouronate transport system permease protein